MSESDFRFSNSQKRVSKTWFLKGVLKKKVKYKSSFKTRFCKASFINSISTWKTLSMSLYEKPQKTSIKKSNFRLISSFRIWRCYFHIPFQYWATNEIVSIVTLFGKSVPLSHFHQGFSLSASLSLMLLFALFSTPTVPPAQPLLRLASLTRVVSVSSDYPKIHKSLSTSTTHTLL